MQLDLNRKAREHRSLFQRFHRSKRTSLNLEFVLGTSLELHLLAHDAESARRAESALLDEIDRLAAILDQRSGVSELTRWQTTFECDAVVSPELAEVLELANVWRATTHGAFHPAAIADASAAELASPLWTVDQSRGVARRVSTLPVSLDAIAKGYIVSRAAARAYDRDGVSEVLLNIGGDIQHFGASHVMVGVADPRADAENAEPLALVCLRNEALATSGGYRRGSHIIDSRSGAAASKVASASVIAPDCDTADALSTAFSVLEPAESVALAESLPGVGCLIVDDRGGISTSSEWNNHASLARR